MEHMRLSQCYKCFEFCHFRPNCPHSDPAICSRCGDTHTHSYTDCTATYNCSNCSGLHSATARICPEYIKAVEAHEIKILAQLIKKYPNLVSTPTTPNSFNVDNTNYLRAARLASTTPQEFAEQLFNATSCLISPSAPAIPSNFSFGCDLAEEEDNTHNVVQNLPQTENTTKVELDSISSIYESSEQG